MHRLLEQYVEEVARDLKALPAEERVRETEEIRQHLDTLTAANLELGISEDEAVKAAITQFGNARQVSRGLRQTYVRKAMKSFRFRNTLAASVGAGIVSVIVGNMFVMWLLPYIYTIAPSVGYAIASPSPQGNVVAGQFVFLVKTLLFGTLIALLTHWMAPKRAVAGALLTVLLIAILDFSYRLGEYASSVTPTQVLPPLVEKAGVFVYSMALVTVLALWYGRERLLRKKAIIA